MSLDQRRPAPFRIAEIDFGRPLAGGELVGIRFNSPEGEQLDVVLPASLLEKLQMLLRHLGELAAAKRAGRPTDFAKSDVFQPFTLTGQLTVSPTDQGPFLLRGRTQEGLPVALAIPRDGAGKLAEALLSMLDRPPSGAPPRH